MAVRMPPSVAVPRRDGLLTFGLILLAALAVRLPSFSRAVIDWDESTFILVGQSLLDGHLPYTQTWDLKPPALFGAFAAAIGVFGQSVPGIRLAGTLCVAVAAWLVFLIARRLGADAWARWVVTVLAVLGTSLVESGQATMSEHVVLPALMSAIYLWISAHRNARVFAAVAALLALATLIRLNVAYVAASMCVLMVLDARRAGWGGIARLSGAAAGGAAVLALSCVPYALSGQLILLWQSAVVAALVRSEPAGPFGPRLNELLRLLMRGGTSAEGGAWIVTALWCLAALGLLRFIQLMLMRSRTRPTRGTGTVVVLGAAMSASIVMSGGVFGHYLIQLVPFAAVLGGIALTASGRWLRVVAIAVVSALAAASLGPVAQEWRRVATRVTTGQSWVHGPAVDVADFLRREGAAGQPVLLLSDHLAYWFLDTSPPSPFVTHPSTLSRPAVLAVFGSSPEIALEQAFQARPLFVVRDPREWDVEGPARNWLEATLARDYRRVTSVAGRDVYRLQ